MILEARFCESVDKPAEAQYGELVESDVVLASSTEWSLLEQVMDVFSTVTQCFKECVHEMKPTKEHLTEWKNQVYDEIFADTGDPTSLREAFVKKYKWQLRRRDGVLNVNVGEAFLKFVKTFKEADDKREGLLNVVVGKHVTGTDDTDKMVSEAKRDEKYDCMSAMNILLERNVVNTSGGNWKGLSDVNGANPMKAQYDKESDCLPEMNILLEESGVGKSGETGKAVSDVNGESPLSVSVGAVVSQVLEKCVELVQVTVQKCLKRQIRDLCDELFDRLCGGRWHSRESAFECACRSWSRENDYCSAGAVA